MKASEPRPPNPVQSQLPGFLARSRLKVGAHNISYVNLEASFRRFDVPVLLLRTGGTIGTAWGAGTIGVFGP